MGQTDLYVDAAADSAGDGSSWASAFQRLEHALWRAEPGSRIFVAKGVYTPNDSLNREAPFYIPDSVSVYGGFAGDETGINDSVLYGRDFEANETVLSGDLLQDDVYTGDDYVYFNVGENAFHVVLTEGTGVHLDGFVIEGGRADDFFEEDNAIGGGMIIGSGASVSLKHVWFRRNWAQEAAGGLAVADGSYAELYDVHFKYCRADGFDGGAGGMAVVESWASLYHVSFYENYANGIGGGLAAFDAQVEINGAKFVNNSALSGGGSLFAGGDFGPAQLGIANTTVVPDEFSAFGTLAFDWVDTSYMVNTIVYYPIDEPEPDGPPVFVPSLITNNNPNGLGISHSMIAGVSSGDNWNSEYGEDWGNNLGGDPEMIAPFNGDIRLIVSSPALYAGDPDYGQNIGAYQGEGEIPGPSVWADPDGILFEGVPVGEYHMDNFHLEGEWLLGPVTLLLEGDANFMMTTGGDTLFTNELVFGDDSTGFVYEKIDVVFFSDIAGEFEAMISVASPGADSAYVWLGATAREPQAFFVDANATVVDSTDGSSWELAFDNLQAALKAVGGKGDVIFVAEGVYRPDVYDSASRFESFKIYEDIRLYGGFEAGDDVWDDSVRENRDWREHASVLSGDLAGNDGDFEDLDEGDGADRIDNSYHVVMFDEVEAMLNGFIVEGGAATEEEWPYHGGGLYISDSRVALKNVMVRDNLAYGNGAGVYSEGSWVEGYNLGFKYNLVYNEDWGDGGGFYNGDYSHAQLHHVRFESNATAGGSGGGLYSSSFSEGLIVEGATFFNNRAGSTGGGLYSWTFNEGIPEQHHEDEPPVIIANSTFMANGSGDDGGGLYVGGSEGGTWLVNVLAAFNEFEGAGDEGDNLAGDYGNGGVVISHSMIPEAGFSGPEWNDDYGIDAGGNIAVFDPFLIDPPGGDERLFEGSPLIGAGDPEVGHNIGSYQGEGEEPFPQVFVEEEELYFGRVGTEAEFEKRYRIYGRFLEGDVAITGGTDQFMLAEGNDSTFATSLTLSPDSAGFIDWDATQVTVRFAPDSVLEFETELVHASPGADTMAVYLSGEGAPTSILYVKEEADSTGDGSSWASAFPRLEWALDSASAVGDVVFVASGTYTPYFDSTGFFPTPFLLPDGVRLIGGWAGDEAITEDNIDSLMASRDFEANETILNGDLLGNDEPEDLGNFGGDEAEEGRQMAGLVDVNDDHQGSRADNLFTVLYGLDLQAPTLVSGFTVTGGHNSFFFGIGGGGMAVINANQLHLANMNFHDNDALLMGGALFFEGGRLTVEDSYFNHNLAFFTGGAVNATARDLYFEGVEFSENLSTVGGAAVAAAEGEAFFNWATFEDNNADQIAGALLLAGEEVGIANSYFTNNRAGEAAGAVLLGSDFGGEAGLANVTFAENYAGLLAHALAAQGAYVQGVNVILWNTLESEEGQIAEGIEGAEAVWQNSLIQGSGGSDEWNEDFGEDAGGNLDVNPRLVEPFENDVRLFKGSPAIGAGLAEFGDNIGWYQGAGEAPFPIVNAGPEELDFGVVAQGNETGRDFTFLARNLVGDVTITAPEPFMLKGEDDSTWSRSITYELPADSIVGPATVRVRFAPEDTLEYWDSLAISTSNADTFYIYAYGVGVEALEVYVDDDAEGSEDGSDWENAFTSLQDALETVYATGHKVYVAGGGYVASDSLDPYESFWIPSGVQVYGGFDGTEGVVNDSVLDLRDLEKNASVLWGDLLDNDESGDIDPYDDNTRHLVMMDHVNPQTVLDGFVLASGAAVEYDDDGSGAAIFIRRGSPALANLTFWGNSAHADGGAVYATDESSVRLRDARFLDNWTWGDGGAIFLGGGSSLELNDAMFIENQAGEDGGAIATDGAEAFIANTGFLFNNADYAGGAVNVGFGSQAVFANVTAAGNTTGEEGAAIFVEELSGALLTNTILWDNYLEDFGESGDDLGNPDPLDEGMYPNMQIARDAGDEVVIDAEVYVDHSLIMGSGGSTEEWNEAIGTDLGGNIDENPLLVNWLDGSVVVAEGSPALEAGNREVGANIGKFQGSGVENPIALIIPPNDSTLDFGSLEVGEKSAPVPYYVAGEHLVGPVWIVAPHNFKISFDGGDMFHGYDTLLVTYEDMDYDDSLGLFLMPEIWVSFEPRVAREVNAHIWHFTPGLEEPAGVAVSGTGTTTIAPPVMAAIATPSTACAGEPITDLVVSLSALGGDPAQVMFDIVSNDSTLVPSGIARAIPKNDSVLDWCFTIAPAQATGGSVDLMITALDEFEQRSNTQQVTVTFADPVTVALTASDALCNGESSGTVTAVASGGMGGYTYELDSGITNSDGIFTGLAAGTYVVWVTDSINCVGVSDTVTVGQPDSVVVSGTASDAACNGEASGSITVSATGGDGTFMFSLDGGTPQASGDFTGLAAGSYTVTATDGNNCASNTASFTIGEPSAIVISDTTVTPETSGEGNGAITVIAGGGTGTLEYSIDGATFQASADFTGLSAGDYTVTVRDENGCTATIDVTVDAVTGIGDPILAKHTSIYPNPTAGSFVLEVLHVDGEPVTIELISTLGQVMQRHELAADRHLQQALDLSGAEEGLYLVRITVGERWLIKRVAVQR